MTNVLLILVIVSVVLVIVLQILALQRVPKLDLSPVENQLDALEKLQDRAERGLREELARNRDEAAVTAKQGREEMDAKLIRFGESLHSHQATIATLQKQQLDTFAQQLTVLSRSNEERFEKLRTTVEAKLKQIQEDNARQLEQMRATVDEKLQGTLEKRLGESFKLVSERLELVHKGLGEMHTLATGVGDLKRVLTNVKQRGGWGEVQLSALLEEMLSPEQYARNVQLVPQSRETVDFAIKLPGRTEEGNEVVWLPLDSKFPLEDYQRLLDAQDRADFPAAAEAAKALTQRIKLSARSLSEKYLHPPHTTDFGIMFLPTEGLFAEVVRQPGLLDELQRVHRITVMAPTTLAAFLNSLQMGFRTLAIQKRSSEVWNLLSSVKTEFGKFGETLEGVKEKLDQASKKIEEAATRSRSIERKLRGVGELPAAKSELLLPDILE